MGSGGSGRAVYPIAASRSEVSCPNVSRWETLIMPRWMREKHDEFHYTQHILFPAMKQRRSLARGPQLYYLACLLTHILAC